MGLSALGLTYGNFRPLLEPFPVLLRSPDVWVYLSAAILLVAGCGLFLKRTAPACAVIIGSFELVWTATRARPLFLGPVNVGSLYGLCEAMGPLIGVWILYAMLRRQDATSSVAAMTGNRPLQVARVLFGADCVVYGAAHFAYAAYTAAMVPAWLPNPMGIVYLTGACHAVAGLGIVIGFLSRLAATLEAIMMSLFGILVWLPSFFSQPRPGWASPAQVQWSETFLTFLMAGSAFIVASSIRGTVPGSRRGHTAN